MQRRTRCDKPIKSGSIIQRERIIGAPVDRLTGLTTYVEPMDSGGFSAAGRRLKMSTTMVSNHVQALEDRRPPSYAMVLAAIVR
jgi:hypothetical protein